MGAQPKVPFQSKMCFLTGSSSWMFELHCLETCFTFIAATTSFLLNNNLIYDITNRLVASSGSGEARCSEIKKDVVFLTSSPLRRCCGQMLLGKLVTQESPLFTWEQRGELRWRDVLINQQRFGNAATTTWLMASCVCFQGVFYSYCTTWAWTGFTHYDYRYQWLRWTVNSCSKSGLFRPKT